ncbi:hypothetical protein C0J52_25605 [Blattella germanica]|nr:hypothetical protein C0J52_25605 [Blattella germanica]
MQKHYETQHKNETSTTDSTLGMRKYHALSKKLNAMPNFVGILRNIQTQFKTHYESIEKLKIWFSVFDTPFAVDFKDIQDAALQASLKVHEQLKY